VADENWVEELTPERRAELYEVRNAENRPGNCTITLRRPKALAGCCWRQGRGRRSGNGATTPSTCPTAQSAFRPPTGRRDPRTAGPVVATPPAGRKPSSIQYKGNDYRLVVKINYQYRVVYVRFVGTHAECDKVNVEKV
jgi:HigB_toxin, RelE-like toxic component of a toxin-antitoxin system